MKKPEPFQKVLLIISLLFLIASFIFIKHKNLLKIGYYFPIVLIMFSILNEFFQLLSILLKILWIACIAGVIAVIVSLLIFPIYKVVDIATILILLFVISYNKVLKRNEIRKIKIPANNSTL